MITVQLIGLGNIGIGYDMSKDGFLDGQTKTHAKAILESCDFELISFTDTSVEKVAATQKFVKDLKNLGDQFLETTLDPDLAVVAVCTTAHVSVVESLIYTPKTLIIEKPGGSTAIECSRIASWGVENNVRIFINYFRRFLSCSVDTRLHLSKLITGDFLSAEINAYGSLLNIFSHFIDLGIFLTGRQIFCACTNKILRAVGDGLFVVCESCNASFRLGGIGKLKSAISMVLKFEFIEILITQDGKRIEIVDKVERVSTVFECEISEYENYQKVVYGKIGAMLRCEEVEESYLGLEQAKKVHLFLESVDLNYEK